MREHPSVDVEEAGLDAIPRVRLDRRQPRGHQAVRQRAVVEQAQDGAGHRVRIARVDEQSRGAILDEERNNEEAVRLLLSGAHGFLPHSQVGMRLGRAVRFIANGHFWVAPGVFESYLTQMRKGSNDARQVTPRESEILDLLRLRLSNKEIAEYLRIRVSTVKFHVTHILSKLQISSRQDLFTDDFRGFLNKLPLT